MSSGAVRVVCIFFFSSRRRHTRCSRDWSSDVCSSDLKNRAPTVAAVVNTSSSDTPPLYFSKNLRRFWESLASIDSGSAQDEIGRASCRERVEIRGRGGSLDKKRKY